MEHRPTEFAAFYESTRDDCLRIVLLNVGDRHLAHDLVAEAYTRAWVSCRLGCGQFLAGAEPNLSGCR